MNLTLFERLKRTAERVSEDVLQPALMAYGELQPGFRASLRDDEASPAGIRPPASRWRGRRV
jgi:hypothetical protein